MSITFKAPPSLGSRHSAQLMLHGLLKVGYGLVVAVACTYMVHPLCVIRRHNIEAHTRWMTDNEGKPIQMHCLWTNIGTEFGEFLIIRVGCYRHARSRRVHYVTSQLLLLLRQRLHSI